MLAAGTVLQSRYRVVVPLGQGGMGAVYRVWDTRLNAPLALKEMTPQPGLDTATLSQLRHQFQQEASVLANLNHPSLVDVTDFFEEGGSAYLVMKFVEGESLADRIAREGALPEDRVLAWAGQLLDALDYCHGQGVIHRDIKPQNVIICPDGRAVLVDFGLLKLWDPSDPRTRTAMRGMGTPEYAPPEQYGTLSGHTDPRSDIYGLGATLYHALTGQAPVSAGDRMAALSAFPSVRDVSPGVSAGLAAAVSRAMELPVPGRFRSAAEMRAALKDEARALRDEARAAEDEARASQSGAVVPPAPAPAAAPAPGQPTKVMPGSWPAARPRRSVPGLVWALGGMAAVVLLIVGIVAASWLKANSAPTPTQQPLPTKPLPTSTSRPTLTPDLPIQGDSQTRPADGMVMVYIPAGEFEMGSTDGGDDEQPVHEVVLDGFWIDRTEVTNARFAAFLNEQGNQTEGGATWLNIGDEDCRIERSEGAYRPVSGYANHPVIEVTWYGAAAYCEWVGGRLPTEAEWEVAARGPEGYAYPWGNSAPDCSLANYWGKDGGCVGGTTTVGSYPTGASWVGAQDLAGNVWEWVGDWYGPYAAGRQVNPTGPSSGELRVVRGGSWDGDQYYARCSARLRDRPDFSSDDLGFRCVSPVSHSDS